MLQALFRDLHASAFLICCEQVRHPSCAKLFHIQFFMQNISYTFFWNTYSLSNFTHFHLPVIQYHMVHFNDFWCCCTFWTSFTWIIFKAGTATFKLCSPFLSCWKRRRGVPINFYELRMNFIWRETFYKEFYNCTILNFIHFKGYRQHSCFRQLYKTNYLIEWLTISHGCLWHVPT